MRLSRIAGPRKRRKGSTGAVVAGVVLVALMPKIAVAGLTNDLAASTALRAHAAALLGDPRTCGSDTGPATYEKLDADLSDSETLLETWGKRRKGGNAGEAISYAEEQTVALVKLARQEAPACQQVVDLEAAAGKPDSRAALDAVAGVMQGWVSPPNIPGLSERAKFACAQTASKWASGDGRGLVSTPDPQASRLLADLKAIEGCGGPSGLNNTERLLEADIALANIAGSKNPAATVLSEALDTYRAVSATGRSDLIQQAVIAADSRAEPNLYPPAEHIHSDADVAAWRDFVSTLRRAEDAAGIPPDASTRIASVVEAQAAALIVARRRYATLLGTTTVTATGAWVDGPAAAHIAQFREAFTKVSRTFGFANTHVDVIGLDSQMQFFDSDSTFSVGVSADLLACGTSQLSTPPLPEGIHNGYSAAGLNARQYDWFSTLFMYVWGLGEPRPTGMQPPVVTVDLRNSTGHTLGIVYTSATEFAIFVDGVEITAPGSLSVYGDLAVRWNDFFKAVTPC